MADVVAEVVVEVAEVDLIITPIMLEGSTVIAKAVAHGGSRKEAV